MTCEHAHIDGTCVTICRPRFVYVRRVARCPWCRTRRRIVQAIDHSPYYPAIFTCCTCGDSWSEGFVLPRPFRPRWRQEESAKARARWADGMPLAGALAEIRPAWEAEVSAA